MSAKGKGKAKAVALDTDIDDDNRSSTYSEDEGQRVIKFAGATPGRAKIADLTDSEHASDEEGDSRSKDLDAHKAFQVLGLLAGLAALVLLPSRLHHWWQSSRTVATSKAAETHARHPAHPPSDPVEEVSRELRHRQAEVTRGRKAFEARRNKNLQELDALLKALEGIKEKLTPLEGIVLGLHHDGSHGAQVTQKLVKRQAEAGEAYKQMSHDLANLQRELGASREEAQARLQAARDAASARRENLNSIQDNITRVGDAISGQGDIIAATAELLEVAAGEMAGCVTRLEFEEFAQRVGLEPEEPSWGGLEDVPQEDLDSLRHAVQESVREAVSRRSGALPGGTADLHGTCLSLEEMAGLVQHEVEVFRADRTGRADFAAAALGGRILKHSDSWTPPGSWISPKHVHRLGLEGQVGPPEDAISMSSHIGQCWAMAGSSGELTVQLSQPVLVDAVSLEHPSRKVTLDSRSAVKDFEVFAMGEGEASLPEPVVQGRYSLGGRSVQTFAARALQRPTTAVTLKIKSNHGHPDYTCIYRLRVHGTPAELAVPPAM